MWMMFINVSKNICYTNYVQSLGLSIQQGWGGWGRDRHMSKSWLSSTILLCSIICTRTYHSCFCNHCPYLATCSAAATIASTIFHLLIIFNEPGAWPKVSYIFLNAHFKKKNSPQSFFTPKSKGKKSSNLLGPSQFVYFAFFCMRLNRSPHRLETQQPVCEALWLTMPLSPQNWYQCSFMRNANYPQKLISAYIFKTLGLKSRSPLHTFKTALKYEIIWYFG